MIIPTVEKHVIHEIKDAFIASGMYGPDKDLPLGLLTGSSSGIIDGVHILDEGFIDSKVLAAAEELNRNKSYILGIAGYIGDKQILNDLLGGEPPEIIGARSWLTFFPSNLEWDRQD